MVGMIYPVPTYIFNWHISPNTNQYHEYIQLIYILLIEYFPTLRQKGSQKISKLHLSPTVGFIYPISPYIFNWLYILEIVYFTTPCTKGAQKHSNLHFSHGWHDISNTNIYFLLKYIPQTVGCVSPIQICILKNLYSPTLSNNTFLLQGLAWYIQYQYIYSTDCINCMFPNPAPEGWTETLQLDNSTDNSTDLGA